MVWHLLDYGLIRRYLGGSGGFVANAIMEGLSMTNVRLAEAFLQRARARLSALGGLRDEADFSDVFREARDILELCYRGMLRIIGIEVPRWLDVGDVLNENIGRLPSEVAAHRDRFIEIYRDLRRERKAAPVDEVPIPVVKLLVADADRAIAEASWVLDQAQLTLDILSHKRVPAPNSR